MIKLIKWYFDMWRKPEKEWTGEQFLDMIWASTFIIIALAGIVVLTVLIINGTNPLFK